MLKAKVASSTLSQGYEAGKAVAAEIKVAMSDIKLIYMYSSAAYDQNQLLEGAKSILGTIPIIGNTSFSGIITPQGYIGGDYFVGMMAVSNNDLTVGVAGLPKQECARSTGKQVAKIALERAGQHRKPDYFYMAAPPGEEEDYLKGITEVIGRIPLFGGSAADNEIAGNWQLYTDEGAFADGVAIALFYSDQPFANEFTGTYHETGKVGIITKVKDHRLLMEIDHMPALDKYREWTGCTAEEASAGNLLLTTITAPLGVKDRLGDLIAIRHPMFGNQDHSISVGNNLATGTAIQLMQASVDELIDATATTLHDLKDKLPIPIGAFHLVHCGGRKAGINSRIDEVFKKIKTEAGDVPFIVEFTFGEYGFEDDGQNTCGGLMLSFTGFGA